MPECNVDEIIKQLKVLDSLRELRENMGDSFFMESFPELTGIHGRLDSVIEEQETKLTEQMSACGKLDIDELPVAEVPVLSEVESEKVTGLG
jgi:hypothetical protein